MPEIVEVNNLVAALDSNPRINANNAAKLLHLLPKLKEEAAIRAAIQGLKHFFVVTYQEDISKKSNKRQKTEGQVSQPEHIKAAEDAYIAWVKKQHANYISQLFSILGNPSISIGIQVSVVVALMESVRSEEGLGRFSPELYQRLLTVLLTSAHVKPEVFTLLFSKFLGYADVRYFTLCSLKRIADSVALAGSPEKAVPLLLAARKAAPAAVSQSVENASVASSAAAPKTKDGKSKTKKGKQQLNGAAAAAATAAPSPKEDEREATDGVGASIEGLNVDEVMQLLSCNCFDVLNQFAPVSEALPAADSDPTEWRSWSGGAEAGIVAAGSDRAESSKGRRKRQEQEQAAGGAVSSSAGAEAPQIRASWLNLKNQKRAYGDAWMACLRLPLPASVLRRALLLLPTRVIPHVLQPLQLSDLLTFALNRGGLIGILALHGLFLLVTKHGLEYPSFYTRLYQLITADVFAAKHRSQFFKLVDIFLGSPLVPAYTVAAFIKRFARLALTAPPAGALLAIAFVHNLIRRHPGTIVMINRPAAADKAKGKGSAGEDVYDELEPEPAKCRAVESSLWELEALRNHYCPQVSVMMTVLEKDLTDRAKTSEVDVGELLQGSYSSLFSAEVERRLKTAPVAFYPQVPQRLFEAASFTAEAGDFRGWAY